MFYFFSLAVRTSTKRSATQLPSPSMPHSQVPKKIARLALDNPSSQKSVDLNFEFDPTFNTLPEPAFSASVAPFAQPSPTFPPPACETPLSEPEVFLLSPPDSPTTTALTTPTLEPLPAPIKTPPTFESLPSEIRRMIYLHLPDIVFDFPLTYCHSHVRGLKQHPLTSVSRLIRSEALKLIHAHNTWNIKLEFKIMYEAFRTWIDTIGDEGAGALRIVIVGVRSRKFRRRAERRREAAGQASQGGNGQHTQIPHHQAMLFVNPLFFTLGAQNVLNSNAVANNAGSSGRQEPEYCPPDGEASYRVDLSEKWEGGKVEIVRCDGSMEAGECGRVYLEGLVRGLWEKRGRNQLRRSDWVEMVERFLEWTGWWI